MIMTVCISMIGKVLLFWKNNNNKKGKCHLPQICLSLWGLIFSVSVLKISFIGCSQRLWTISFAAIQIFCSAHFSLQYKYDELYVRVKSVFAYRTELHFMLHVSSVRPTIVIYLYHSLGLFSRRQTDAVYLMAHCQLRRQLAWNVNLSSGKT